MEIRHENKGERGIFEAFEGDVKTGEMTYEYEGDKMIVINHTRTFSGHEGKGVGRQLVAAGIEYAQENGLKIKPICSFVRAYMSKHPELADMVVELDEEDMGESCRL